jgi:hypothetical protein
MPAGDRGEAMHGDWVTAIATVFAAIVGTGGGFWLARYQRERRAVYIVAFDPEDLAASLREHGNFEIKWSNFSTTELILTTIGVQNVGNKTLEDFELEVKIPGQHTFAQVNCAGNNTALVSQIVVSPATAGGTDPEFKIKLPFFNPEEGFRLNALYSGTAASCKVNCRLPGTTVRFVTFSEFDTQSARRYRLLLYLTVAAVFTFALLILGNAAWRTWFFNGTPPAITQDRKPN